MISSIMDHRRLTVLAGDMIALYFDEDMRTLLAKNTVAIHVPTE